MFFCLDWGGLRSLGDLDLRRLDTGERERCLLLDLSPEGGRGGRVVEVEALDSVRPS